MRRLLVTLALDARLQYRHGFYAVSLALVLLIGLLLRQLPLQELPYWLVPTVVAGNLVLTCFFFMGALVLLEKTEGVIHGLAVSPQRDSEYLASKVSTLTALALIENAFLLLLGLGPEAVDVPLLLGTVALAVLFSLSGFIVIVPRQGFNDYFLPAVGATLFLLAALLGLVGVLPRAVSLLHPAFPPLLLMRSGDGSLSALVIAYAVVGSLAWPALAALVSLRVHRQNLAPVGHLGAATIEANR